MKNKISTTNDQVSDQPDSIDKSQLPPPSQDISELRAYYYASKKALPNYLKEYYNVEISDISKLCDLNEKSLNNALKTFNSKSFLSGIGGLADIYSSKNSLTLLEFFYSSSEPNKALHSDLEKISLDMWRSINMETKHNKERLRDLKVSLKKSRDGSSDNFNIECTE